jgi:hypothetical protein
LHGTTFINSQYFMTTVPDLGVKLKPLDYRNQGVMDGLTIDAALDVRGSSKLVGEHLDGSAHGSVWSDNQRYYAGPIPLGGIKGLDHVLQFELSQLLLDFD